MNVTDNLPLVRERLVRLYAFLREHARIRHPFPEHIDNQPWRLWFSELPSHPVIRRGFILPEEGRKEATTTDGDTSESVSNRPARSASAPTPTSRPAVPVRREAARSRRAKSSTAYMPSGRLATTLSISL